ncbi:MAG: bifunctional proline dehydrogenase/L-glutamate gamma-semialdehyde dehydrogenase PutA [Alphaproteobacteria bacterium]
MSNDDALRAEIRENYLADEAKAVRRLIEQADLSVEDRTAISKRAAGLVRDVRAVGDLGLMESFLAEYGLSTKEGIALMCLAEALLRVPDAETIDELISDKISPADWGRHLGHASSSLVNASTWALMLTGRVLRHDEPDSLADVMQAAVRRLGEPVIRTAVGRAMREMGRQFVLGRNIDEAIDRARGMEAKGYTYSYDMLGEAARTEADARRYHLSYATAITRLSARCESDDIRENPGISVKLSALHPRYEQSQKGRVTTELVDRARSLAMLAKSANMGFNIDAEEADRLDLSLDVIEAIVSSPALAGWDGFGIVVQAFGQRASFVLDWIYDLAKRLNRRFMVRLVKGAYWDTEVKRAQVLGLNGFPVFTRKANTDVSYISCARKLLQMNDRIYPQFATHNAHTVEAVLHMAGENENFEFQRLHGMGEALHQAVRKRDKRRCRIYAPVGRHQDLLAYLVRRLLENGANSSFVNQIVNEKVTPEEIAADPITHVESFGSAITNPAIVRPAALFGKQRRNAKGWDITDPVEIREIDESRHPFEAVVWEAFPIVDGKPVVSGKPATALNPSDHSDTVGAVHNGDPKTVDAAFTAAGKAWKDWNALPAVDRGAVLLRIADLYEENAPELMALAAREAGKTWLDAVGEIREAVDFCRFYALEAVRYKKETKQDARGIFVCVSPWNFPLAIFTGQITAALAAGNAVIAKPAEQTPLLATRAVQLMHDAGVPGGVLNLIPGDGATVGAALTGDPRVDGICFTGSTDTAMMIHNAVATKGKPDTALIAETGGLNAMIVDSTALPEQAVRDILASAFQSAGQRCSALRMLYIQEDVIDRTLEMLFGAMDELRIGVPWDLSTDIGPVIDEEAQEKIVNHCEKFESSGNLLKKLPVPDHLKGTYVSPAVIRVNGIEDLQEEIFGPVLHIATFGAEKLNDVIAAVNATGYGLTFGLHTRVDNRVQLVTDRVNVGNLYVNRNQIGAIVGSQPFGGAGLSGTGPKAGGPHYLGGFLSPAKSEEKTAAHKAGADLASARKSLSRPATAWKLNVNRLVALEKALSGRKDLIEAAREIDGLVKTDGELPGPTGESNRLSLHPRGDIVCLGSALGVVRSLAAGNAVIAVDVDPDLIKALAKAGAPVAAADMKGPDDLTDLPGLAAVISTSDRDDAQALRQALAKRSGPITALLTPTCTAGMLFHEKVLCIDTTAAGGNASLLAAVA